MNCAAKIFIIVIACLWFNLARGQGCIDTIRNITWRNPQLGGIVLKTISSMDADSSFIYAKGRFKNNYPGGSQQKNMLIKSDKRNAIIWAKSFVPSTNFITQYFKTFFFDSKGQSLSVYQGTGNPGAILETGFLKLSKYGLLRWAKKVSTHDSLKNAFNFYSLCKGNNDDVIVSFRGKGFYLSRLDSNAVQKWGVSMQPFLSGYTEAPQFIKATVHKNSVYIAATLRISPGININYYSSTLFLIKLDYQTGALIQKKSYTLNDTVRTGVNNFYGIIGGNYNLKYVDGTGLILAGKKNIDVRDNQRFHILKADSNLNVLQYKIFNYDDQHQFANNLSGDGAGSIADDGSVLFANLCDNDNNVHYFLAGNKLNLLYERSQNVSSLNLPSSIDVTPNLISAEKGELLYHAAAEESDSLFQKVRISSHIEQGNCMGTLAPLVMETNPGFTDKQVAFTGSGNIFLTSQPTNISLQDETVTVINSCETISVCDMINLSGPARVCADGTGVKFILYKNPLCLRKTVWAFDTSYAKLISFNDTVLEVKFLRPYRGKIYAGFLNCTLSDSISVEVYQPKHTFNIGGDRAICDGKNVIITAEAGFRSYQWQDGSTGPSFVAAAPGKYYVMVTDSCGNSFSDTVQVFSSGISLLKDHAPICSSDTARLVLPGSLLHIKWLPAESGFRSGNVLSFAPPVSTVYSIEIENMYGCVLKDTLLVKILDCPEYIYFPTAFTPDNNGTNDMYRPLISGRMIFYEFFIYNRWGQLVFSTRKQHLGWDGKLGQAQADQGSFVWICNYRFAGKPIVHKRGSFLLLR